MSDIENRSDVEIKNLIKRIKVCEPELLRKLEWLAKANNHALEAHDLSHIVRYLLNRVMELEEKLNQPNPDRG